MVHGTQINNSMNVGFCQGFSCEPCKNNYVITKKLCCQKKKKKKKKMIKFYELIHKRPTRGVPAVAEFIDNNNSNGCALVGAL